MYKWLSDSYKKIKEWLFPAPELMMGSGLGDSLTIDEQLPPTGGTDVTTVGTITTGTWQGTAIADAYIASAATWNAAGSGDLLADGTTPLTANWDAGAFKITAETLESDVATGTAPLVVASTTEVANLKAATATLATTATDAASKTGTGSTYATNTSPTFVTPLLGTPTSGTLTNCTGLPATGVVNTAATLTDTQTLTNKRITSRVATFASDATPDVNTDDYDAVTITAQAAAITDMNFTGTPTNFQKITVRIKDNATPRAITWGADFEDAGTALPTTTVTSKLLTAGFIYNTVTSKWGCVAVANET